MNKLIRHTIILLLGLLLSALKAHGFVSEMWPEEGQPVFRSKVAVLTLHEQPSITSNIKKHKRNKGELITYDETRYRNVRSGSIKVTKTVTLEGRDLGALDYLTRERYYSDVPDKKIQFRRGETIEYLQARAEGSCIIKWKTKIIELEYCSWFDDTNKDFQVISEPINEWWIRVVINKKPIGWLLIDDKVVDEHREF